MPKRHENMDRPICPVLLVDFLQAFAKGMGGYPDDSIGLRIEVVTPPQSFGRDRVFLDLLILIQEMLLANKYEHPG